MPWPTGEDHHNAKLSNDDVELIRQLYESGGIGYRKIAEKFECGESTVRDIVKYMTR